MLLTRTPKPTLALLLGSFLGVLGVLVSLSPLGLVLEEDIGLDWHFILRGKRIPPEDAVIVSIDKESAQTLNLAKEPVKWPRSLFAKVVNRLTAHGAHSIGIDILFKEQKSAIENQTLADAITRAKHVILFLYLDKRNAVSNVDFEFHSIPHIENLIPPIPVLAQSALALAPFPLPKVPAKVSQYWTFKQSIGGYPTLPIVMSQMHLLSVYNEFYDILIQTAPQIALQLPKNEKSLITNKLLIQTMKSLREGFEHDPTLGERLLKSVASKTSLTASQVKSISHILQLYRSKNSEYLNFYGPARTIKTIPIYKILALNPNPEPNQRDENVLDKCVFIGLSEPLQLERVDNFFTPFSRKDGIDLSGIEIAATAFNNVVNNQTLNSVSMPKFVALLLIWGLTLGIVGGFWTNTIALIGITVISITYYAISYALFKFESLWLPYVVPLFIQMPLSLFLCILKNYIDANKERNKLRHAFGFYLPDKILDEISDNFSKGKDSNRIVYGTCLSTDAQSYTALSENLSPSELGKLMNQYFNTLFLPIKQNKGIVCDIIGDEMMAVWTTPMLVKDQRHFACDATLKIMQRVADFNSLHPKTPFPTRAGLHSGEILLGNVGAINHFEYRPVGDIVNTASRIQGLNKYLNTQILVTREVIADLENQSARRLGKFMLAGKSSAVEIYELLNSQIELNQRIIRLSEEFEAALSAFHSSNWNTAETVFKSILARIPNDGPSQFFLSLCTQYRKSPPEAEWDGTIRILHK